MKALFLVGVLLFEPSAFAVDCKSVVVELGKPQLEAYGRCKDPSARCSFTEDSTTKLPVVIIPASHNGFSLHTNVNTSGQRKINPTPVRWTLIRSSPWEEKPFGDSLMLKGDYQRKYEFEVADGSCSLKNVTVSFLPEGKNETARQTKTLTFSQCKVLGDAYNN